jgi:hypothetical protein
MAYSAKLILIGLGACSLASLIACSFYVILRLAILRTRAVKIDDGEMRGFKKKKAREEREKET